ncbi:hypothetical protein ACFJIV_14215 [Mucilaginibacter sp. UC70_90]
MKKLCYILFLTIGMLQFNCSGFVNNVKLIGNYSVVAIDEDEQSDICYFDHNDKNNGCIPVITSTVFAVGYNKDFIIAQQHPRTFPNPPDKTVTNYYILPVDYKNKHWGDKFGLIGPLTSAQFKTKRMELSVPDSLKFTIIKSDLK